MATSQNGYQAYNDTNRFVRYQQDGFSFWAFNADVATVFAEFIRRFDAEVEEITQKTLDDWSWANRNIRGSDTQVSNHASATAIDLNATKHPRGVHNTFTPAQRAKMHAIRDSIVDNAGVPVLRLGMDYTQTVDDMHVEINRTAIRVAEAAARIRATRAAQEKAQEDDVTWLTEKHKLTESDAKAYGGTAKEGDEKTWNEILRFPPATARLRREEDAASKELLKAVTGLTDAVKALTDRLPPAPTK